MMAKKSEKGESGRFAYDMFVSRGVEESTLQKSLSLDAFRREIFRFDVRGFVFASVFPRILKGLALCVYFYRNLTHECCAFVSDTCKDNGPGSSVGIVTDYGPDGLGSNPGGDENFLQSRPALGSTQPPVK